MSNIHRHQSVQGSDWWCWLEGVLLKGGKGRVHCATCAECIQRSALMIVVYARTVLCEAVLGPGNIVHICSCHFPHSMGSIAWHDGDFFFLHCLNEGNKQSCRMFFSCFFWGVGGGGKNREMVIAEMFTFFT